MRHSNNERRLGTFQILLVIIKNLAEVHRLKLLLEIHLVVCHQHELRTHEKIQIFFIITRKVENNLRKIHPILILNRLSLDLVHSIEGERSLVLREVASEALDDAFGLVAKAHNLIVVREGLEHLQAALARDEILLLIEVTKHAIDIQHHDWQLRSLCRESLLGDQQAVRDAIFVLVGSHARVVLGLVVLSAGGCQILDKDTMLAE